MKRKVAIVFVFIGVYILGFITYNFINADKAIFNKVINSNGYTIQHIGKPVPLEYFIKPEWIPSEKDEKISVNEKLIESHNTTIVLDAVWNQGEHISFSFLLTYDMKQKDGVFLHTDILNGDGSSTLGSNHIKLYDIQQNEIETDGIGIGPGPRYSFDINKQKLDFIRDGFHVVYNSLQLHEYSTN